METVHTQSRDTHAQQISKIEEKLTTNLQSSILCNYYACMLIRPYDMP